MARGLTSSAPDRARGNFDHHALPEEKVERRLRWLLAFYYFAALIDTLTFIVFLTLKEPKAKNDFGWHFTHLTTWGGYVQIAYFVTCIADTHSLLADQKNFDLKLHEHRDRFFGFAFALGTFIAIGYWIVLFPFHPYGLSTESYLLTVGEHGVTSLLIWIEMIVIPHQYAPLEEARAAVYNHLSCCCKTREVQHGYSEAKLDIEEGETQRSPGSVNTDTYFNMGDTPQPESAGDWHALSEIGLIMLFVFVYLIWNLICFAANGHYPYPIQAVVPIPVAVISYLAIPFFVGLLHIFGNILNSRIHSKRRELDDSGQIVDPAQG
eukprot:CAMPEP_0114500128 /NCGR_PEP_ID=MMETSP0109-20121206/7793_1 /TAXON_ID=29199 /ORGANISM="Chlorarachnion reptans, Strain CCCM449" /LENGTH=321 /DNA_ID=CAMNT_0001677757 /DNA_START=151 /DNA_END=1116 /DNA_ORIENTATION=+